MTLKGCVLTFLIIGVAMYLFSAGFGLMWWGRGFVGAMEGRHAPERVRAASTVYIYDGVIEVERDRVVFRRSAWAPIRAGLLAGLGAAIVALIVTVWQRKKARWWMLGAGLIAGAIAASISVSRHAPVVVARGTQGRVEVQRYGVISGGRSTRSTYEDESGFDIVLVDGGRTTRLVRLPWNVEEDANIWRGLIEEKLRP